MSFGFRESVLADIHVPARLCGRESPNLRPRWPGFRWGRTPGPTPVAARLFPHLCLCPLATRDEWIFNHAPSSAPIGPGSPRAGRHPHGRIIPSGPNGPPRPRRARVAVRGSPRARVAGKPPPGCSVGGSERPLARRVMRVSSWVANMVAGAGAIPSGDAFSEVFLLPPRSLPRTPNTMHTALYGKFTVALLIVGIPITIAKVYPALYRGLLFHGSVYVKENRVGPSVAAKNYAPFVSDLLFGAHGACGATGGLWRSREAYLEAHPGMVGKEVKR